jgi:alkylhydroperoxidase/carboxymuconolactone decarboxylase family protein YurZ
MSEPGPEAMARFVGAENVDRGRQYLEQLDPELHRYIIEFVYGEVYAGDVLDPRTHALCTVAMLATLGQQLQLGVDVQAPADRAPARGRSGRFGARSRCTQASRAPGMPWRR